MNVCCPALLKVLCNFYWVFNNKKFSLPAALSQTVIQRRSAGSWIAELNYYRSSIKPQLRNAGGIYPSIMVDANKITSSQISLGGGYAYNYVFGNEHCLLHTSFMPMISVWHRNRIYSSMDTSPLSQNSTIALPLHRLEPYSRLVGEMPYRLVEI